VSATVSSTLVEQNGEGDRPDEQSPAWLREIHSLLGVVSQFMVYGNVRDHVLTKDPGETEWTITSDPVTALLPWLLRDGYQAVFRVHPFAGLEYVGGAIDDAEQAGRGVLGDAARHLGTRPLTAESITTVLQAVVQSRVLAAVFAEDVMRLATDPANLDPAMQALFASAEVLARRAIPLSGAGPRSAPLFNSILWLTPNERGIPDWLLTGNERVRAVSVPLPELSQREVVARIYGSSFEDFQDTGDEQREDMAARFAQQTHGMTLAAMQDVTKLALGGETGMSEIEEATRAYRVGVPENPWLAEGLRSRLRNGQRTIQERLVGQADAIRKSLDVVVRSTTGLTGAHASARASKPRGVLFFAGPTGVGKTELAKALTELIFGDEQAYIRFDMSEFSSEHNVARLIGAPPGYTGFDAGGELTNAVRERPFSLILFDEIEKADGRVLDKFLQVLDDGRLTDGRGATVYFTEAVLVFTSNLGIYEEGPDGRRRMVVSPDMDRDLVDKEVREAITRHFHNVLGRPELLNRLGDIVVFDFIGRPEGEQILEILLRNVKARFAREFACELELTERAKESLAEMTLHDLSYGGRGIGSHLERALVDPLARAMFASPPAENSTVTVTAVLAQGRVFELELA
jgi:ATP-dependent Clp protease ATP-binding subunit ClpB